MDILNVITFSSDPYSQPEILIAFQSRSWELHAQDIPNHQANLWVQFQELCRFPGHPLRDRRHNHMRYRRIYPFSLIRLFDTKLRSRLQHCQAVHS